MAEQEVNQEIKEIKEVKEIDEERRQERNSNIFDFIVLLGMVANIIIAVFMLLYYFDLF